MCYACFIEIDFIRDGKMECGFTIQRAIFVYFAYAIVMNLM